MQKRRGAWIVVVFKRTWMGFRVPVLQGDGKDLNTYRCSVVKTCLVAVLYQEEVPKVWLPALRVITLMKSTERNFFSGPDISAFKIFPKSSTQCVPSTTKNAK